MKPLSFYLHKFSRLKTAKVKGVRAPHKPILLLSIIQLIQQKDISSNHIYISASLVATFKDIWKALVTQPFFTANFSLPFYHLQSDGFWHLHTHPGKEILLTSSRSIKSFSNLQDAVWYASVDEDLFELLANDDTREILKQTLLKEYFDKGDDSLLQESSTLYTIQHQMLTESAATYKRQIDVADEEEIFIRSGVFKKVVPTIYNHTCCISGMRIISTHNIQMIDACHIVPFSLSHDDTISNGISLCPNLHRAFDRNLIAIDDDYRVVVSDNILEHDTPYSIRSLAGKRIQLPTEEHYFPNKENLAWHRQRLK